MSALKRVIDALKTESAFALANSLRADCAVPEMRESAGALFLTDVRDAVIERAEWYAKEHADDLDEIARSLRDEGDDVAHEIADGAVPVYTHPAWKAFVDLAAYNEDLSDWGPVDADNVHTTGLYVIGRRLASRMLSDLADAAAEDAR